MIITSIHDAPPFDSDRFVAEPFLDGTHCNVRVIRLSPGQALPPHTHGSSDLMLFVAEGEAVLDTSDGPRHVRSGSLAHLRGDEELRVANHGAEGVTLLAFLAPPFPPRAEA